MKFQMTDNGYNPLTWNCAKQGCFNKKRRPKIELFAECFPGQISMGDWDGVVEINGYFLVLEWKSPNATVKQGQQISFEQFTSNRGYVVFVVEGDPETMRVDRYCWFWNGKQHQWTERGSLEELKQRFINWKDGALKNFQRAAA